MLSQSVVLRTREIGIRVALGAEPHDIRSMFVSHGLLLAAVGIVIGWAGAASLSRVLDSLLFNVGRYDPVSYAAVAVGLTAIAFLACWLPTRRAMRVDPAVALRTE